MANNYDLKCPHCGRALKKKVLDPAKVAQDLLEGFNAGLKGDALMKYAQRSMPKAALGKAPALVKAK